MRFALVVLALIMQVMSPLGQQNQQWAEIGYWTIAYDSTLENSCYMVTSYEDGSVLRVGFNTTNEQSPIYILIGNDKWASLEAGKDYDIVVQMDNEIPWEAPATGFKFEPADDLVFLHFGAGDFEFLEEFMSKHGVTLSYNNREIASLSLRGSSKATEEMVRCQLAMGGTAPSASDPFGPTPVGRPSADPFV